MQKINFTKMVASGNDFIIVDSFPNPHWNSNAGLEKVAHKLCDRKYGIGADGLLVLEKSKIADIKMRIFNADGSEAEMCGNGARCVALYVARCTLHVKAEHKVAIETKAGIIDSKVKGNNVKIKLTDPRGIKLNIPVKVNNRTLKVNFINTGVPHTVIFVEGLDKINIVNLGKQIRYHQKFSPRGTNVDFTEIINDNTIKVRTYERGIEDETLACGTGSVAAALIYPIPNTQYPIPNTQYSKHTINAITKSGEILKVYFDRDGNNFKNVWLEGKARIVYTGVYYV